jgi:hypothetical protein
MGQQAPVEIKESWDPSNEKKNALASAVAKDLPHLQVRSGGSTSVDISEQGIDKAYAVRELASLLDVAVNDIVFIGDRMDPEVMITLQRSQELCQFECIILMRLLLFQTVSLLCFLKKTLQKMSSSV